MKTYLEIAVTAGQQQRELLIPTMVEFGCQGFEETDSELLCYIDQSRLIGEWGAAFQTKMRSLLQTISSNASVRFREIVDQNWNKQWEKSVQPIEVGERFVIKPSWCKYENRANRIIIQIDPKMAFGTGYHETTRLTLHLLEQYVQTGCRVLDVGTGTGILAIAAVKLGAVSAIAIDNDEWAITNARENIGINRVADRIEVADKPVSAIPSASIDLITANLTLSTNVEMLSEFNPILSPGGSVLLSGFLTSDRETMKTHLQANRFEISEELTENEWSAIAAHKHV
jgi:ribosomal protein L11 methyltransferase